MLLKRLLKGNRAFTLIELLVVIGMLAILATVTVLIINPAQFLAQSRDARRASDLQSLRQAFQNKDLEGQPAIPDNKVYISLPDNNAPSCTSHSLPNLNPGWSYACASPANYRRIDGFGWIPRDFNTLLAINLAKLPIDPTNNDQFYYTYIKGRSLTAALESAKQVKSVAQTDGGYDSARYEIGTKLDLWLQASGFSIIGNWHFDDGSGTTPVDSSGSNFNGSAPTDGKAFPTWNLATCKISNCLSFDGNSYVKINNFWPTLGDNYKGPITYTAWFKANTGTVGGIIDDSNSGEGYIRVRLDTNQIVFQFDSASKTISLSNPTSWHFVALSSDLTQMTTYLDGATSTVNQGSCTGTCGPDGFLRIGGGASTGFFNGLIDEVHIYKRALTKDEIDQIYNSYQ